MKKKHIITVLLSFFLVFTMTACKRPVESNDNGYVMVEDFYFFQTTTIIKGTDIRILKNEKNYGIEFQPKSQRFFIDLKGNNLQLARNEAEKELIKSLNITQKEACRLKLNLGIQGVGQYGLSFCPDGKPLP
ncbi:MAG: hypothetical protein WC711_04245 [Candidatus Staskawiczbacteria bacterium]